MPKILYYFYGGPQDGRYRGMDTEDTQVVLESPGEATTIYEWNGTKLSNGARVMVVVEPEGD